MSTFRGGEGILKFDSAVVEPTQLKNFLINLDHFPRVRGENKKAFELTAKARKKLPGPKGIVFQSYSCFRVFAVKQLGGVVVKFGYMHDYNW